MPIPLLAAAALVAALQDAPPPVERGRALFLTHCATCHGEAGDGKGVTELDRPARSFQAGGFSFGNTPEAIFRTLSSGIPGSPMPAFDAAMSAEERRLVAAHVIALGPEEPLAPPADSELVVTDRPLVVRGKLPPIVASAVERPRGLLIGLTDGLTAEYRSDDVRLLGLRMGRFVDRRDWTGRGGSGLAPLGQVVHVFGGGDPAPLFELAPAAGVGRGRALEPLRAELAATWVRGARAGVTYRLVTAEGRHVATVEESVRALATSVGAGFARRFEVEAGDEPATLVARALLEPGGPDAQQLDGGVFSGEARGAPGTLAGGEVRYAVARSEGGLCELALLALGPYVEERKLERGTRAVLTLTPGARVTLEDAQLSTRDWAPETRKAVARELFP